MATHGGYDHNGLQEWFSGGGGDGYGEGILLLLAVLMIIFIACSQMSRAKPF